MAHVCNVLTAPDANGLQTCTQWQEQTQLLPKITIEQAQQIGLAIVSILVLAWCFSIMAKFIKDA